MMGTVGLILTAWVALSVPVSLAVGRMLSRAAATHYPASREVQR